MIKCWCDGSCKPSNPGPAGAGFVIVMDDHEFKGSVFLGPATNNIAELKAVEAVLLFLKERGLEQEHIEINTDSQYAIGMFSKNWKAKLNTQLVNDIRVLLNDFPNVIFSWVKGHDGNHYNEIADQLAKLSVDSQKDMLWL